MGTTTKSFCCRLLLAWVTLNPFEVAWEKIIQGLVDRTETLSTRNVIGDECYLYVLPVSIKDL